MATTPTNTTDEVKTDHPASVEVPRQDQVSKQDAETAQKQFAASGGADADLRARTLTAEQVRQEALKDDEDKGLIHGIPKAEFEGMTLGQQRRVEMNNPYSNLRNRLTVQDEVDFHIFSNTNAYTIEAMTGVKLPQLVERAKELGVQLKESAAGNGMPGAVHG